MKESEHRNAPDGDEALWELLGNSRETKVGPMFARNVVREVRLLEDDRRKSGSRLSWFFRPAFQLAGAAALLTVCGVFIFGDFNPGEEPVAQVDSAVPAVTTEDTEVDAYTREFESIENLGELMAISDPAALSDEALLSLLF